MMILGYVLYKLTIAAFQTTAPHPAVALAVASVTQAVAQQRSTPAMTAFDVSPM